jgi:branched-chain amino acid transport system substrate-binding protein
MTTIRSLLLASLGSLAAVFAGGAVTQQASAQEIKVGVVLPYTSVNAKTAQQMDRGIEMYLKLNADQVKPYTIRLFKRDAKNPGGADAKLAVQELLTEDKIDAVVGGSIRRTPSLRPRCSTLPINSA